MKRRIKFRLPGGTIQKTRTNWLNDWARFGVMELGEFLFARFAFVALREVFTNADYGEVDFDFEEFSELIIRCIPTAIEETAEAFNFNPERKHIALGFLEVHIPDLLKRLCEWGYLLPVGASVLELRIPDRMPSSCASADTLRADQRTWRWAP